MKKTRFVFTLLAAGILTLVVCQGAMADSGKPIAGVLDSFTPYGEFTFKSAGNQVLFAEIKTDIYQTNGRKGGSHETGEDTGGGCTDDHDTSGSPDTSTSGGCTDSSHTDDTHDDSCGGGAGDLCLQVLDPNGGRLCWAGRPDRPGWQRDPRLACPIPEGYGNGNQEFVLRVFRGQCGNPVMDAVTLDPETQVAYLLDVQLLDMAQAGSLKAAMAQSGGD